MFREIILPIFRSTRLCVTVFGIMHPQTQTSLLKPHSYVQPYKYSCAISAVSYIYLNQLHVLLLIMNTTAIFLNKYALFLILSIDVQ